MIMLNHLPAQLNMFKAIKQKKFYKDFTLLNTTNLINQIKKHAQHINQKNIINFYKTKFRDNTQSKSNNNYHKFRNQNIFKCDNCDAKHLIKRCFYTHSEFAFEEWQLNKEVKEKIVKRKTADKKKVMIKKKQIQIQYYYNSSSLYF